MVPAPQTELPVRISTRVKVRPELEKALALAHQFKEAAPETPVIFTVHELKRLARNAAELMTLSAELQAGGIYDPNGMGAMFFAVLAVAGQIKRNYIREKTLEGQVIDDDSLTFALALKDKSVPVRIRHPEPRARCGRGRALRVVDHLHRPGVAPPRAVTHPDT